MSLHTRVRCRAHVEHRGEYCRERREPGEQCGLGGLDRARTDRSRLKRRRYEERTSAMLWTIFIILMILWLLGVATSYTLGGFIHILLVLAIASVLIRIIQGRAPV
jgi:hypothetical protein